MALVVVLVAGPALANVGQAEAAIASLIAFACVWRFAALEPTATVEPPLERTPRGLLAAMLGFWLANLLVFRAHSTTTVTEWAVLAAGVVAAGLGLVRPPSLAWTVRVAVALGIAVRLAVYAARPIDPLLADMLPAVRAAAHNLLGGHDPYTMYQMPAWVVPLAYFPLTLLAYVPATALGVDLRATNVVLDVALGAVVWTLARRRGRALAPALWAWTFIGVASVGWSADTEHPVGWLLLAATLALAADERPRLTAIALGLSMAASPLTAPAALFLGLHWLRTRGPRATAGLVALSLVPFLAFVVPFYLWNPKNFLFGVFQWHNDNSLYPSEKWRVSRTWETQMGLSGLFWRMNRVWLLKPLQAIALALLAVRFWRRGAAREQLLPAIAVAYVAFAMLNPMLWGYLYWPAGIAALLALAA
jgi:hypothetical protein